MCDSLSKDVSDKNRGRMGCTDAELVRVAQRDRGSERGSSAAAELLRRHQRSVYSWCFRYVKDRERALDLSQDVLLRAYENLDGFAGRSKFSSWLFSIARNRCLNEMRRVDPPAEVEADLQQVPDASADPCGRLMEKESEERVIRLIRAVLEPLEQEAIRLRCFERVPVDKITCMLGIRSGPEARVVLQRARRKLRAAL